MNGHGNLPPLKGFPRSREAGEEAFSLVEISLALGLVAFCLVALLALFQAGLQQGRRSLDQTRAAHILEAILEDYRGAARNPRGGVYSQPTPAPASARFQLPAPGPGEEAREDTIRVDDSASVVRSAQGGDYVAHYRIEPPPAEVGAYGPGRIRVEVAWPAVAEFTGAGRDLRLGKAQGYVEATLEVNHD